MANEQNQHKLEFELTPEVSQGQYSNLAVIAHSSSEFVLDFASLLPGMPKAKVKSRIITTPEHAKKLMLSLQENIARYERTFGSIDTSKQSLTSTITGGGFA